MALTTPAQKPLGRNRTIFLLETSVADAEVAIGNTHYNSMVSSADCRNVNGNYRGINCLAGA
jgi:hypothetical protein